MILKLFAALAVSVSALMPQDAPGLNDLICQQLRLGYTPRQLAEMLHRGGAQCSESQCLATIYNTMGLCD
jgi:hypothetical protein